MITLKRSGSKSQGNLVWRFQDYEIQDLDIFYRIQKDNKSIENTKIATHNTQRHHPTSQKKNQ